MYLTLHYARDSWINCRGFVSWWKDGRLSKNIKVAEFEKGKSKRDRQKKNWGKSNDK